MKEVTDPTLLAQLNAGESGMKEVTDPSILAQLNQSSEPKGYPSHSFSLRDFLMQALEGGARDVKDLQAGAAAFGQGVMRAPHQIVSAIDPSIGQYIPEPPEKDTFAQVGITDPNLLDKIIAGIPQYAPYALGGEALAGAKALGSAPNLINRILGATAGGGAFGLTQSDTPGKSSIEDAILGGVLEGVPTVAKSVIKKAVPTNWLASFIKGSGKAGAITPEEFRENLKSQPTGIQMPIGDVANSSKIQALQKVLESVPFSGISNPYQDINAYLKGKSESLMHAGSDSVHDINDYAYNAYKNSYENARQKTNNAYDLLSNASEKTNTPFDSTEYDNSLNNILAEIKDRKPGDPEYYGKLENIFKNLKNVPFEEQDLSTIVDQSGNPIIKSEQKGNSLINNFSDAVDMGKRLNSIWRDSYLDRAKRGFLGQLRSGLNKSIEDSVQDHPELSDLLQNALNARKEQGSFERLPNGKESPFYSIYNNPLKTDTGDFLSKYLKSSPSGKENVATTDSLFSKLNPSDSSLISYNYLLKDKNLAQQSRELSKLSDAQRQSIFKENAPIANELVNALKLFPEGKAPGYMPKTGLTGAKAATASSMLASSLTSLAYGNLLPLVGSIGALGGAKGLSKLLSSELLKNAYLKSLEKQGIPKATSASVNPFISKFLQSQFMNKENNNSG